jgi:aryl-alcohol dehydrogenase-like predicted oxidoreductase
MQQLRLQGKIGLRGVAVRSPADGLWLIRHKLVDVLQITYNLLETEVERELLQVAGDSGVGLLCRMPLAQGILTGKFQPGQPVPAGHRAHLAGAAMDERIRRVDALRSIGSTYPGGLTRMALHFSLTPPAISAIIPGARDITQLEENIAASNGTGLDETTQATLRSLLR